MSRQYNVSTVPAEPIFSASKHLSKGEAQKPVAGFHIRSHQLDLIGHIDGFVLEPPITKQGFPNRSDSKVKIINSPSVPGERGLADCTANPFRSIAWCAVATAWAIPEMRKRPTYPIEVRSSYCSPQSSICSSYQSIHLATPYFLHVTWNPVEGIWEFQTLPWHQGFYQSTPSVMSRSTRRWTDLWHGRLALASNFSLNCQDKFNF
jgi:hypothetical protein